MVKKTKNAKKRGAKKSRGSVRTQVVRYRKGLDAAATAYARLLADPCGAPLTKSIGYGSGDSILVRTENDAILFNGATDTGGWAIWCPATTVALARNAADDTSGVAGRLTDWPSPAGRGLASVATSVRCVAACLQVFWPGTELSRQGVVGLGVIPATALSRYLPATSGGSATNLSVSQARTLCQHTERMPDTMAEITWRPGPDDQTDYDLGVSNTAANFAGNVGNRNAILLSIGGIPVATGVRIRTVAVFEYTPIEGQGLAASVETPRSVNTQNEVLQAMDASNPKWWLNGFKQLGTQALTAAGSWAFKQASSAIAGGLVSGGTYATRAAAPLLLTL